jgi:hypothetical protein
MSAEFSFSSVDWSMDLNNYLQPFFDNIHLHLVSFAFWMFLHFASGYFYQNYTSFIQNGVAAAMAKDKKKRPEEVHHRRVRLDLMIKTVALVHAVVSSAGAIVAFLDPRPAAISYADAYTLEPFYAGVCVISSGYFLYDFAMAIMERDIAFFLHGSLSYAIFGHSSYPFLNQVGALFLIYEISTVFLNIRFLMITTGATKHRMFNIIQWMFFGSFMLVRMGWGSYYSLLHMQPFLYNLLTHQNGVPHSHIAVVIFSISNASLQALNIMWSGMMVKTIKRQLAGAKPADKAKTQ